MSVPDGPFAVRLTACTCAQTDGLHDIRKAKMDDDSLFTWGSALIHFAAEPTPYHGTLMRQTSDAPIGALAADQEEASRRPFIDNWRHKQVSNLPQRHPFCTIRWSRTVYPRIKTALAEDPARYRGQ